MVKRLNLKIILIVLVFIAASYFRFLHFDEVGKDITTYEDAVRDFLGGKNPYVYTVKSFSEGSDPSKHGFAYLPGLLYIYSPLYLISKSTDIPFHILWKIPVFLSDIGVGILLCLYLYKKNYWALIFGLLVWFFNPYLILKGNYIYSDSIPVFFMFFSLYYLGKRDNFSGLFYGISIALKTFPYLLFPIMLIKAKDKKQFLIWGAVVGLLVSIPFMISVNDFMTYLQGAVLVHSERSIQGRPFLFYVSYFYHLEFLQVIPLKVYTTLASFLGWVIVGALYLSKKIKDTYSLSLITFISFYIFTPVLNRTYTIWFLPLLILGAFELFDKPKKRVWYYILISIYYVFYIWYLIQWKDGFQIYRPQ
jgi:hypothetical protein